MKQTESHVNTGGTGFVPLRNVMACAKVMEHLVNRAPNLPGMGVFAGPSGYGKSCAASYCANKFNAYYIECRSYFTKKSLLLSILDEMGVRPGKTIYEMVAQIAEQLALSRRPLIVDEMDHIVDRNLVELVRDLYESSDATILMIGEERFPQKLKRWERFHNRVLDWTLAEPADLTDAGKLARLYSPDVEIGPELLAEILKRSRGVARRVCVNVEQARQHAKSLGAKSIDLKAWGSRPFYTGEAPARRAV